MSQRCKIWLFAVILVLPLFSASAQEYEIRLRRANKPGDRIQTTIAAREIKEMSATANGQPFQSEKQDSTVEFDGVVEILKVEAKGRATKVSATVDRLVKKGTGGSSVIAPKGATIIASVNGLKQAYLINGSPAGAEATKALDLVFALSRGGPTDDEIFGTKEKKKVGESWNINAALAKKGLVETLRLPVKALSGKVTLKGIVNRAGGEALKISADMVIQAVPPLPANLVMDKSTAEARLEGEFPVDFAHQLPDERMNMKFTFAAHGEKPDGGKVLMTIRLENTTQAKRTLLK